MEFVNTNPSLWGSTSKNKKGKNVLATLNLYCGSTVGGGVKFMEIFKTTIQNNKNRQNIYFR